MNVHSQYRRMAADVQACPRPASLRYGARTRSGETAMALTLYFAPGASSMAVHIALYEAGAAFDARPVSFAKKEQHEAPFLSINPLGQVPVLVIDGRPLTEVAGCLFYIARAFPDAKLLPGDAEGEAQAGSWIAFIA